MRLAAEIAPIRMTGNYGSEILRRLRAFKPSTMATDLFQPEFIASVDAARETYGNVCPRARGHFYSVSPSTLVPVWSVVPGADASSLFGLHFSIMTWCEPHFEPRSRRFSKTDIFEDNDECGRLIADGNRRSLSDPDRSRLRWRGRMGGPDSPRNYGIQLQGGIRL